MKVKIFLTLTIVLFLFTGWQFSRNFTVKTERIMAQRNMIQDEAFPPPRPPPPTAEKYLKSDKEFKTVSSAEIELQREILKAEEAKRKAEEKAAQTASLQLWLSFAGTIFSGITTIVLARINKK